MGKYASETPDCTPVVPESTFKGSRFQGQHVEVDRKLLTSKKTEGYYKWSEI